MSEFWWGVLALPIIVAAVAGAACLGFGAWLLIEKWFVGRYRKLEPIRFSEAFGDDHKFWTVASLGLRGGIASLILAGAHARLVKFGSAAVVIIWGKPDGRATRRINTALTNAMTEVSKTEDGADA